MKLQMVNLQKGVGIFFKLSSFFDTTLSFSTCDISRYFNIAVSFQAYWQKSRELENISWHHFVDWPFVIS